MYIFHESLAFSLYISEIYFLICTYNWLFLLKQKIQNNSSCSLCHQSIKFETIMINCSCRIYKVLTSSSCHQIAYQSVWWQELLSISQKWINFKFACYRSIPTGVLFHSQFKFPIWICELHSKWHVCLSLFAFSSSIRSSGSDGYDWSIIISITTTSDRITHYRIRLYNKNFISEYFVSDAPQANLDYFDSHGSNWYLSWF